MLKDLGHVNTFQRSSTNLKRNIFQSFQLNFKKLFLLHLPKRFKARSGQKGTEPLLSLNIALNLISFSFFRCTEEEQKLLNLRMESRGHKHLHWGRDSRHISQVQWLPAQQHWAVWFQMSYCLHISQLPNVGGCLFNILWDCCCLGFQMYATLDI